MTSPRKRRAAALAGAAALAAGLAGAAAAAPLDLLHERALMSAANARCGLFDPQVAAALSAGQAQARGDSRRSGASAAQVAATEADARRRAAAQACDAPSLRAAAARVRSAFEGYARIERMTYPGEIGAWRADRGSSARPRWRLAQSTAIGGRPAVFGLAGRDGAEALLAVAEFPGGRRPYAARLVMRDVRRTSGPVLDRRGTRAGATVPLSRRMPAGYALKSFPAEAREAAPGALAPSGMKQGWAFRFPAEAAGALAGLDPREAVAVEFLFSGAPETMRAYIEVGDFAAARQFLTLAR
ncbi:hypothetical protein [Phenylobacterium sp.]|jgi:hypothetical protein|uniref:hypothetical protein n=1 Tax=Phenylobacterium sp. TaxID=1871053 RepID=UPI002E30C2D0|nr:hypothetical protein [Phenylobacterium sp.]HEX2561841.1 hypothetical protein [Phenylobacterium sp.]